MKAEGSAQTSDAHYVWGNCIQNNDVGLLELITPEVEGAIPNCLQLRHCRGLSCAFLSSSTDWSLNHPLRN